MKKFTKQLKKGVPVFLLTFAALLFAANSFAQKSTATTGPGAWTDAIWNNGVPVDGDDVTINHAVTHPAVVSISPADPATTITLANLTINGSAGSLIAPGLGIIIPIGGNFQVVGANAEVIIYDLYIGGKISSVNLIDIGSSVTCKRNFFLDGDNSMFENNGELWVEYFFTNDANAGGHDGFFGTGLLWAANYAGDGLTYGYKPTSDLPLVEDQIVSAYQWTGNTSDDWEVATNWLKYGFVSSTIPGSSDYITLTSSYVANTGSVTTPVYVVGSVSTWPVYTNSLIDNPPDCFSLTVTPGAQMIANGDLDIAGDFELQANSPTTAGSFQNTAIIEVFGSVTIQVYAPHTGWNLLSPTVVGETYGNLTTNNPGVEMLGEHSESDNTWNFTHADAKVLNSGQGYAVKVTAPGVVSFEGTDFGTLAPYSFAYTSASLRQPGWHLVGNQFGSAFAAAGVGTGDFLAQNATYLDPGAWGGLYYLDGTGYHAVTAGTATNFQAGQAFFVKAVAAATTSLNLFQAGMCVHDVAATIKSGSLKPYKFDLIATQNDEKAKTSLYFNGEQTLGLDQTYDVAFMSNMNKKFGVCTKLVEGDNYPDLEHQVLPDYDLDRVIIPVGLNSKSGGQVTFSAADMNLPNDVLGVYIEDKFTGRFTDLTNGTPYTTQVDAGTMGEGRFFIHMKALSTGVDLMEVEEMKAFYNGFQEIQIEGHVSSKSTARVFDMSGKLLGNYLLKGENTNVIPVGNLDNGVYILQVVDGQKVYKTRIPVL